MILIINIIILCSFYYFFSSSMTLAEWDLDWRQNLRRISRKCLLFRKQMRTVVWNSGFCWCPGNSPLGQISHSPDAWSIGCWCHPSPEHCLQPSGANLPGGYTTLAWGPASIRPNLHALCILWDQAEACLNTSILSFLLNTILLPSSLSSKETQNKLLK